MPPNPAFRRAAHSLAHPITLAAIALLRAGRQHV
jgi:hypothetical protein